MWSFSETLVSNNYVQPKFRIFYILGSTHETYRSPLSKRKTAHSGVGGKKQSNDLAVTQRTLAGAYLPVYTVDAMGGRAMSTIEAHVSAVKRCVR